MNQQWIKPFEEIDLKDWFQVGGKNASLGEMIRALKPHGIQIPTGFAITVAAFQEFIEFNRLDLVMKDLLMGLDPRDLTQLKSRSKHLRSLVMEGVIPKNVSLEIEKAYQKLSHEELGNTPVSIRSSAASEDLPSASFAGQLESYLNIDGIDLVLESMKRCYASLYSERALSYRITQKIPESKMGISVGVQKMVRSDLAVSGVMFTLDPETGFRDAIVINSSYGLGESVVKGLVNPDEFMIHKPKLNEGFSPIIRKFCGLKESKTILDSESDQPTRFVNVSSDQRSRFSLSNREILHLARLGIIIENHYTKKYRKPTPMDIEWAKDGLTGEFFILQARPETVHSHLKPASKLKWVHDQLRVKAKPILNGKSVGQGIISGTARIIHSVSDLDTLQEGEILVADKTDPDWEPVMKRASAIVTNRGSRTCHAAIIARELGVPAVVGCLAATQLLHSGLEITVQAIFGSDGHVFEGVIPHDRESIEIDSNLKSPVDLKLILGNPDEALRLSSLPVSGVGLLRLEFMIGTQIRIHPMAIARYLTLRNPEVIQKISELTQAYPDPEEYFIDKLSEGIALICAAFYPREVIARLSDFKSNEYSNLIGGALFEQVEENPMIGFRGAFRYLHPLYQDAFELECRAIIRVREKMGFENLHLMIPFCRTPEEGTKVISQMNRFGLRRNQDGPKIQVMCEIPSNVILASEFAEVFDGFSIGSNDLTQLVLGLDRDSEILASQFDEKNPAVLKLISEVIRIAHQHHRQIGICGQAPSDDPAFMDFLIREKIDSVSVNPDSFIEIYSKLGRS